MHADGMHTWHLSRFAALQTPAALFPMQANNFCGSCSWHWFIRACRGLYMGPKEGHMINNAGLALHALNAASLMVPCCNHGGWQPDAAWCCTCCGIGTCCVIGCSSKASATGRHRSSSSGHCEEQLRHRQNQHLQQLRLAATHAHMRCYGTMRGGNSACLATSYSSAQWASWGPSLSLLTPPTLCAALQEFQ